MTENKFTEKEILKALYCCNAGLCEECPVGKQVCFETPLEIIASDLIGKQKAKIDELEYILMGVMHSVDKWLEDDELKQDEVNRAATMREKTLQIVENTRRNVARKIAGELLSRHTPDADGFVYLHKDELTELVQNLEEKNKNAI